MPDVSKEKFTAALATDLSMYCLLTLFSKSENPKEDIADFLLEWSKRVDDDATIVKKHYATQMAGQNPEMTEDVAMILLDINNIEKTMDKNTFAQNIYKDFVKRMNIVGR
jgi:hypothetical protein